MRTWTWLASKDRWAPSAQAASWLVGTTVFRSRRSTPSTRVCWPGAGAIGPMVSGPRIPYGVGCPSSRTVEPPSVLRELSLGVIPADRRAVRARNVQSRCKADCVIVRRLARALS